MFFYFLFNRKVRKVQDENPKFFPCALCETFAFFALKKCEKTFLTVR